MKLRLNKRQAALIIGAPEGGPRPILENLCLRDKTLSVADGFMLISTPTEAEGEALLPTGALRTIRAGEIDVEIEGKKVKYTTSGDFPDGKYPDYLALTKFKTAPLGYVAINAAYLSKLCELAKEVQGGIIHLYVRGAHDPVEFTIGPDNEYHGLICPMFTKPDKSKLYPVVP